MKKIIPFILTAILVLVLLNGCTSSSPNASSGKLSPTGLPNVVQEPEIESPVSKLSIGQTVQIENFGEYTLKAAMLYNNIDVGMVSRDKVDGVKLLVFIFEGKNLTTEELQPNSFMKLTTTYREKYTYQTKGGLELEFVVPDSNSFPSILMPLKVSSIFCIVEIPDEVAGALSETSTTIQIKDQPFQFVGEIENASLYIDQIQHVKTNLEPIVSELSSITMDMNLTFDISKEDLIGFSARFAEQKVLIDALVNELSAIIPPAYYREGHDQFVQGLTMLQSSVAMVLIENVQDDLSIYGETYNKAGEQMTAAGTAIQQAQEKLEFLDW